MRGVEKNLRGTQLVQLEYRSRHVYVFHESTLTNPCSDRPAQAT